MSEPTSTPRRYQIVRKTIQHLTNAYLIRFPLLIAALLVIIPCIAFLTGASQLLENLYDLRPWGIYLVTLTSMLSALSVMVTLRLALHYSNQRFDTSATSISRQLGWHVIFLFSLLAAPTLAGILGETIKLREYSSPAENWLKVAAVIPGILSALLLLWLSDKIQKWINSPRTC
jgi:hypothetical protein